VPTIQLGQTMTLGGGVPLDSEGTPLTDRVVDTTIVQGSTVLTLAGPQVTGVALGTAVIVRRCEGRSVSLAVAVVPSSVPTSPAELRAVVNALYDPADPYGFEMDGAAQPGPGDTYDEFTGRLTARPNLADPTAPGMTSVAGSGGAPADVDGNIVGAGLQVVAGALPMTTRGLTIGVVPTAGATRRCIASVGDAASGATDGFALWTIDSDGETTVVISDVQNTVPQTYSGSNLPFAPGQARHVYAYRNVDAGFYADAVGRIGPNAPYALQIKGMGGATASIHAYGVMPWGTGDKALYIAPTVSGVACTETQRFHYWGRGLPDGAQLKIISDYVETHCGAAPEATHAHIEVGNSITQGDGAGARNKVNRPTHVPTGSSAPTVLNRGVTGVSHDQLESLRAFFQRCIDATAYSRVTLTWWEGVNQRFFSDADITHYFALAAGWKRLFSNVRMGLCIPIPDRLYRVSPSPDAGFADLREWFIHRAMTETATFADRLVRLDQNAVMGAANADLNPTYYNTDGVTPNVHPTQPGNVLLDHEYQQGHIDLMAA
jgi:hypothetical protein